MKKKKNDRERREGKNNQEMSVHGTFERRCYFGDDNVPQTLNEVFRAFRAFVILGQYLSIFSFFFIFFFYFFFYLFA